jgi:hypothetical protein
MSGKELRKIQGLVGEHSFVVLLSKKYANNMGLSKCEWVTITDEHDEMLIRNGMITN